MVLVRSAFLLIRTAQRVVKEEEVLEKSLTIKESNDQDAATSLQLVEVILFFLEREGG